MHDKQGTKNDNVDVLGTVPYLQREPKISSHTRRINKSPTAI